MNVRALIGLVLVLLDLMLLLIQSFCYRNWRMSFGLEALDWF